MSVLFPVDRYSGNHLGPQERSHVLRTAEQDKDIQVMMILEPL